MKIVEKLKKPDQEGEAKPPVTPRPTTDIIPKLNFLSSESITDPAEGGATSHGSYQTPTTNHISRIGVSSAQFLLRMDRIEPPFLMKGRDRERVQASIRELNFDIGGFTEDQLPGVDGYNIVVISSDTLELPHEQTVPKETEVFYFLDRERTVDERKIKDLGQMRKELETCARMLQLDEEDDPEDFIKRLASCRVRPLSHDRAAKSVPCCSYFLRAC